MRSLTKLSRTDLFWPAAGLAWVAALLTLSCSGPFQGTSESTRFYLLQAELPAARERGSAAEPVAQKSLGIGQVGLPEYLKRPQVVIRKGGHRIALSQFDHWGEPLDAGIARVLSAALVRHQPLHRYAVQSQSFQGALDYRLELDILRFDGDPGSGVVLAGRWRVEGAPQQSSLGWQEFTVHQPVSEAGISGVVSAHSQALERLAVSISEALERRIRD